jgi:hypothetical protein
MLWNDASVSTLGAVFCVLPRGFVHSYELLLVAFNLLAQIPFFPFCVLPQG